MKKGIIFCLVMGLGMLVLAVQGQASSPDEWIKYEKEVVGKCIKACGLKNARAVGGLVMFGDEVGFDAVMIRGTYPQPHMKNAVGHALCLFDKAKGRAQCAEANEWFKTGK